MRKYLTASAVAGFVVCVIALSVNEEGLASERGPAEEATAEAADVDAQRQLAIEQQEEWPESLSSDAGIRTAMSGPELIDISVSRIGKNAQNDYREYGIVGDMTVTLFGNKFPTVVIMLKYERKSKNRAPSRLHQVTSTISKNFAQARGDIWRIFRSS